MTEAEWLTATDPQPLASFVHGSVSERKLALFACSCCRHIWERLIDERSREAVEVAERAADGQADWFERARGDLAAISAANPIIDCRDHYDLSAADRPFYVDAAVAVVELSNLGAGVTFGSSEGKLSRFIRHVIQATSSPEAGTRTVCQFFRDIFGNPFRPVAIDPRWQTETVVALATGIYAERAFDRMPILADALEDVGCDRADILNHCRGDGPHVRGCWVVDLLLGKS